ncbi:ElyC/SanA/YdcF family protein [Desulfopila sp. IMCC35008]|uniref:ElyC/SanA/YdcF family protein n=1 Tax=Desulfopila sp. IMCC35008 TaxID=2653858 RepID=UPI0013D47EB0|nr:ElyC/SanA/YdcF family protein [Desulfopila sp. IMCC35008]
MDEKKIAEYRKQKVQYIAVLGSGHVSDPRLPSTSQIGSSSLFRLVEGIRLHNELENSTLIISGGVGYDPVPNARVVAEVAGILGVDQNDMIIEERPRDTIQEAEIIREKVGGTPFILVTSAYQMPRAMGIFEDAGLHPIPAPTNYIIKEYESASPADILPNAGNLSLSKQVMYEKLGYLWKLVKTNLANYQS